MTDHQFVSLTAPTIDRDPATLDLIETPKRDAGPVTSFHTAEFSNAEAESFRDYLLELNKDQPPEVIARKLADLDRAANADGILVKPPMDPHIAEVYAAAGLKAEPGTQDYHPDLRGLNPDLKTDHLVNVATVTARFCADVGFSSELGNAFIERCVEDGATTAKLSPEEKSKWVQQQESLGLKIAGSKANLVAMRDKAISVLARAKAVQTKFGTENFAENLKNSLAFHDPFILSSLATHADLLAELERVRKLK